jgi:hypothetical protein
MFDPDKLSKLRFGMSEVPKIGGQPGLYEEKWSQWFLERSFCRDFVYRNPRGKKKGDELADAVVLFGDVLLMAQVKAQCGRHDPIAWAAEKLKEAFGQLRRTHDDLVQGRIKKLKNDYYGEMSFEVLRHPNRIGLIILAHKSAPYLAAKLAPEILTAAFPVHVFSLDDFATVASRFDTAADLIIFLELRGDIASKESLLVQDEARNIERMIPHVADTLRSHMSPTREEVLQKTVRSFEDAARGKLLGSSDWRYGLAVDDMIARVHDIDPGLPWNKANPRPSQASIEVARFLGWLTRDRRIRLGKKIIFQCEAARDGNLHYFPHVHPSRGVACVYLATSQSRAERIETLRFLVSYAYLKYATKYGVRQCVGVATEPIGKGRSYDFFAPQAPPPQAVIDQLKAFDDPFSSEVPL